ncbi:MULTISPECIES: TNT domain-containing protein [unclassified Frankia]|uniref:TNT domain-containing protein n=1 Tax=unclassified Frankia TaxID=2632575 RepID=UPI0020256974
MQFRKSMISLTAGALLLAGTAFVDATSASAAPASATDGATITVGATTGGSTAGDPTGGHRSLDECSEADFRGDSRLGPQKLPVVGEVGRQLSHYQRTGGEPVQQFLDTWWDPSARSGQGGWQYPPKDGYLINPDGTPQRTVTSLAPGLEFDRFGGTSGNFASPEGTKYAARAIPPSNLDSTTDPGSCNYHDYRVLRTFSVYSGAIRPWFDQPGYGQQYQVVSALIPGAPVVDPVTDALPIQWLLDNQLICSTTDAAYLCP